MNKRTLYGIMTTGGVIGLGAAFIQTLEKIQLLKHANDPLSCDLNSVFSCSNVLNAWQSSVFGFPNSLMCMIFFTTFAVFGITGLAGATLPKRLRLGVHALALFVLAFGIWFLTQSIYVIGSLCLLCIFCFGGLLLANWAFVRVNADDLPIGAKGRARLQRAIDSGADTFVWLLVAALLALAMLLRFG